MNDALLFNITMMRVAQKYFCATLIMLVILSYLRLILICIASSIGVSLMRTR